MTISLIHFNPETGLSASISATGGVAVGGYVNHSWRGIGACATQGLFTNPWYAEKSKLSLEQGMTAAQAVESLELNDEHYSKRQCVVMDRFGDCAFIQGDENIPIVGSIAYPTIAVTGNMLESHEVLDAFSSSFIRQTVLNPESLLDGKKPLYKEDYENTLPETLVNALEEALNAGGDKRGTFSASLRVESLTQAPIDIRVDWAEENLILALRKVLSRVREAEFQDFLNQLPNQ
ncbi:DUF1028 domain-containing protein [Vibrio sp. T187]|uniref:DUF1028 domain-containing protein n=1 Tax=Vibrio TaxID=662 RepID=UPI0010C98334|nr:MULTISPECIES: DUF1028 domain-containing protein [Vibrio]MBW3696868.1 DUF1028 domain-containing protein [Vibrio sp. T187]